jgi:hypothetical protein
MLDDVAPAARQAQLGMICTCVDVIDGAAGRHGPRAPAMRRATSFGGLPRRDCVGEIPSGRLGRDGRRRRRLCRNRRRGGSLCRDRSGGRRCHRWNRNRFDRSHCRRRRHFRHGHHLACESWRAERRKTKHTNGGQRGDAEVSACHSSFLSEISPGKHKSRSTGLAGDSNRAGVDGTCRQAGHLYLGLFAPVRRNVWKSWSGRKASFDGGASSRGTACNADQDKPCGLARDRIGVFGVESASARSEFGPIFIPKLPAWAHEDRKTSR